MSSLCGCSRERLQGIFWHLFSSWVHDTLSPLVRLFIAGRDRYCEQLYSHCGNGCHDWLYYSTDHHATLDSPAKCLRVKGEGQSDEPALQGEDDAVHIPQRKRGVLRCYIVDSIDERNDVDEEVDERVPDHRFDLLLLLFSQLVCFGVVLPLVMPPVSSRLDDTDDVERYQEYQNDVKRDVPEDETEENTKPKRVATTSNVIFSLTTDPAPSSRLAVRQFYEGDPIECKGEDKDHENVKLFCFFCVFMQHSVEKYVDSNAADSNQLSPGRVLFKETNEHTETPCGLILMSVVHPVQHKANGVEHGSNSEVENEPLCEEEVFLEEDDEGNHSQAGNKGDRSTCCTDTCNNSKLCSVEHRTPAGHGTILCYTVLHCHASRNIHCYGYI